MKVVHEAAVVYFATLLIPVAFAITNNRDSYISAYMDFQSSTAPSIGIVYPTPNRAYGPPQPKPPPHYGPPAYPPSPPAEYETGNHPLLEMMYHLPEKLEFLPKIITSFLGITKVLLKIVVLKIILKLVVMFCLFFFLPKLEMLDMATDMEMKPATEAAAAAASVSASVNATMATPVMEDEEEGRFNRITEFVWDSIENKPFSKELCDEEKHKVKCKFVKLLSKLERYMIPSLQKYWLRDTTKNEDNFHRIATDSEST